MIKLKQIIFEIGNRIIHPSVDTIGWAGGIVNFSVGENQYKVKIKIGSDYDVSPGIVRIPEISISFDNIKSDWEYKDTNRNEPLMVLSNIIGILDQIPKRLCEMENLEEVRIQSLIFSTKDHRRYMLYESYLKTFCKNKGIDLEINIASKTEKVYRAKFIPYLSNLSK